MSRKFLLGIFVFSLAVSLTGLTQHIRSAGNSMPEAQTILTSSYAPAANLITNLSKQPTLTPLPVLTAPTPNKTTTASDEVTLNIEAAAGPFDRVIKPLQAPLH